MSVNKQSGYLAIKLFVILVIISLVVGVVFYILSRQKSDSNTSSSKPEVVVVKSAAKIKHLGINLGAYDPETNKAGDFEFTKEDMTFDMLFFDYGFTIPASSAGPERKNPQPTFILPLGTKVHALVDGEVFDVPKLYSNDYSVMVKGEASELIFETEHVINVIVKKGDKVKAGDVIAEVSDYDAKNYAGFGLVEIGILKGGSSPSHLCPFDYLDESIKDTTLKQITALRKSWEEYRGDNSIYDESKVAIPGCLTQDPIKG